VYSLCITIWIREHAASVTAVCQRRFPAIFWMADSEHPLLLATVIWFESFEFMSLGYGYDMALIPPGHTTDHYYELS
jgi:hypothetical protein